MIHVETRVKIPFLWGKSVFKKNCWSKINLIVGPNGSGKTLLAEELAFQFADAGYFIEYLKSERENSEKYLKVLQNSEVREKIQRVLSNMFGKSIIFEEDSAGNPVPIVVNRAWNVEYGLKEAECHGFKEILILLASLYSIKEKTCLFFDEPELHLHPQFQFFFMNELRKVSLEKPDSVFFLVTHSPFFVDLRFPEELNGVIVCHINQVPSHIENLSKKDSELFRRFLPRFNSYHKQFFFSDNQIFVEGYTDRQMFTNLLPFIHREYSSAGTGIIDVGGKDELGVFCKVCSLLGTNGRIITDLDSLFSGKLRDVFCENKNVNAWLYKQEAKQQQFYKSIFTVRELRSKITLEKLILKLEQFLQAAGKEFVSCAKNYSFSDNFNNPENAFFEKILYLSQKHENAENIDTFKTVVLQGIMTFQSTPESYLSEKTAKNVPLIKNLFSLILAATEAAGVFILPKGCIEHYYTQTNVQYMPVSAKDRLFHSELEHILQSSAKQIQNEYADLILILEKACTR